MVRGSHGLLPLVGRDALQGVNFGQALHRRAGRSVLLRRAGVERGVPPRAGLGPEDAGGGPAEAVDGGAVVGASLADG